MKYIEKDLDFIYVRSQDASGHWGNFSLNEISDEKFTNWATEKFGLKLEDDANAKGTPWTPKQKIALLNYVSEKIKAPCVCMIKRSARKEWGKQV